MPTIARKNRGNAECPCAELGDVNDHNESDIIIQI